jgi:hypothetical protein
MEKKYWAIVNKKTGKIKELCGEVLIYSSTTGKEAFDFMKEHFEKTCEVKEITIKII